MNLERRRQLDIPIHLTPSEHSYVDGYCNCGASNLKVRRAIFFAGTCGTTKPKINLDIIERNFVGR